MIAKHVPMRSLRKSDFEDLADYITDAQNKDHRLGNVQFTNCMATSLRDAITEVLATQQMNTRARGDKTYHLIVSFRAGEQPSADTLRLIETRICAGLGYADHQRISAVHTDTDNLHIHIAINKIHPVRHTMHEPYYPHRTLAELCAALERDCGLEVDNHMPGRRGAENRAADMERHAGVESLLGWIKRECLAEIKAARSWQELHQVLRENGLALRVRANGCVFEARDGTMVKASTVARDLSKPSLESRLGPFEASSATPSQPTPNARQPPRVQSAEAYAARKPVARVGHVPPPGGRHRLRALSELAAVRIAGGVETHRDARQLPRVQSAEAYAARKPVARVGHVPPPGGKHRLRALSELPSVRIAGRVETHLPTREYRKDPVPLRVNTVELHAHYKTAQQSLASTRSEALAQIRQRRDRLIEAAKRSNRLRRATIKLVGEGRANKKLLYTQASVALRDEIQAINKQFQQERTALYAQHSRRTWADWLKQEAQQGSTQALAALRAREAALGLKGNTIRGEGQAKPGHAPTVDSITKKGTIIFRAGTSAVRDDGDKLAVSHEATREALQQALRLAVDRYGDRITVNGTVEFKAQIIQAAVECRLPITFAEPALEVRRQALLTKEKTHERPEGPEHRGRVGRSTGGPGQWPVADEHSARAAAVAPAITLRDRLADIAAGPTIVPRKPDIGRPGRIPPAEGQNRLRTLSELGVVRIASGGEVLLPRDVPRDLVLKGTEPDHALRRGVSRPGVMDGVGAISAKPRVQRPGKKPPPQSQHRLRPLSELRAVRMAGGPEVLVPSVTSGPVSEPQGLQSERVLPRSPTQPMAPPGLIAADKYIAERESKRLKASDIQKHVRYTGAEVDLTYAGTRRVDGCALALLQRGGEVVVLPVDEATAHRLSRIAVGSPVSVTPTGSIKKKGRGR